MAAWCKPYPGVTDPLVSGVLAMRDGVIFARLRCYEKVLLETDNLEMVNLWLRTTLQDQWWRLTYQKLGRSLVLLLLFLFSLYTVQLIQLLTSVQKLASTMATTECWLDSPSGVLVTSLFCLVKLFSWLLVLAYKQKKI